MAVLVLDGYEQRRLIRRRRALGIDGPDEVWDGVYVVFPPKDNDHQFIRGYLCFALDEALSGVENAIVIGGVNVSDQPEAWKTNHRCPDVVVILPGSSAKDALTHYHGGPDFVVEILSPGDRALKKLGFYAKVGVRELLLIDRRPWSLELYRLQGAVLESAGKVEVDPLGLLPSEILPVSFRLIPGDPRPTIEVAHAADARRWPI